MTYSDNNCKLIFLYLEVIPPKIEVNQTSEASFAKAITEISKILELQKIPRYLQADKVLQVELQALVYRNTPAAWRRTFSHRSLTNATKLNILQKLQVSIDPQCYPNWDSLI